MSWSYHEDPRSDVQALVSARGARILDVGCAAGALAGELKAAGASFVAGIELHSEAARAARAHVDVLVQGSILDCELPFSAGAFDYIVFADVLEHLPDPDLALERCLPLLAPGGSVVVSIPNMRFYLVLLRLIADRWSYTDHGIRDRTHLRIFTRRSLERMLELHGLEIRRMTRNFRLLEDQTHVGRVGALMTSIVRTWIAPFVMRDLLAFQYVVLATRKS